MSDFQNVLTFIDNSTIVELDKIIDFCKKKQTLLKDQQEWTELIENSYKEETINKIDLLKFFKKKDKKQLEEDVAKLKCFTQSKSKSKR